MIRPDLLVPASHPHDALALPHQPCRLNAVAKPHAERTGAVHEQLIEFLPQQHERGFAAAQMELPAAGGRQQQRMNGEGEAPDLWLDPKVGEHPETERRNGRPARLVARKACAVEKEYVRDAALGQRDRGRAAGRTGADNNHARGHWVLSGAGLRAGDQPVVACL